MWNVAEYIRVSTFCKIKKIYIQRSKTFCSFSENLFKLNPNFLVDNLHRRLPLLALFIGRGKCSTQPSGILRHLCRYFEEPSRQFCKPDTRPCSIWRIHLTMTLFTSYICFLTSPDLFVTVIYSESAGHFSLIQSPKYLTTVNITNNWLSIEKRRGDRHFVQKILTSLLTSEYCKGGLF